MNLLSILMDHLLSILRVHSQQKRMIATEVARAATVYLLLTGSGVAIFVPFQPFLPKAAALALPLLLASLLSVILVTAIRSPHATNSSWREDLPSILVTSAATYLACVGLFLIALCEWLGNSQVPLQRANMFVLITAFLVYVGVSDSPPAASVGREAHSPSLDSTTSAGE